MRTMRTRGLAGGSALTAMLGLAFTAMAQTTDSGLPGTRPSAPANQNQQDTARPGADRSAAERSASESTDSATRSQDTMNRNQRDAMGPQDSRRDSSRLGQDRGDTRNERTQPADRDANRNLRGNQAGRGELRGSPIGSGEWVRVGYDFDDDGRFDSFDYIRQDDLQRIRSAAGNAMNTDRNLRSEERRLGDRDRWTDERPRDFNANRDEFRNQRDDFNRNRQDDFNRRSRDLDDRGRSDDRFRGMGGDALVSGRAQRIEGRVVNMRRMDVRDRQHLVAWIETADNRRVQVDFGPQDRNTDRLNFLREGQQVSVHARRSQAHDDSLMIADRVEHDGRTITLNSGSRDGGFRDGGFGGDLGGLRYSGEILSTRFANFIGHDHEHLLARVRLSDGYEMLIDLGPSQHLDRMDLRAGDRISVTARTGCINGSDALIADELRTPNGQFVRLDNYEAESPLRLRGRPTSGDDYNQRFRNDSDMDWRDRSSRSQESWRSGSSDLQGTWGSDRGTGRLQGGPIGSDRDSTSTRDLNRDADGSTAPVPPRPELDDLDDDDRRDIHDDLEDRADVNDDLDDRDDVNEPGDDADAD